MTFKILSLDGGGIRGVLSARILKEVETILSEQTNGKKLHEYFDLITGTSTGSILTAGIACQMKAQEMIDIYQKEGNNIFLDWVRKQRKWRKVSQAVGSNVLYPHEDGEQGLAKILQKKLIHPELGSPKISQIAKPYILIPAYDVYSRNTTWFNNSVNEEQWYYNIELWKICTASASAPTFFPPYELPYNENQYVPHIDGGVSANNPALMAIAHALLIEKTKELKLSDIAVLSIGTGNTTRPYDYETIKNWGALGWAGHLPDMFMSPASQMSEAICEQILDSVEGDILRLDFDLNERFEGEKQGGKLRELLKKPYNKYILKKKNKSRPISEDIDSEPISEDIDSEPISEDIDNPENCTELIEAAQCYLECGDVYYKKPQVPVREAIQQFIDSHGPYQPKAGSPA